MPVFKCENPECGVMENTATSNYWTTKGQKLCSQCDPQIGKWHGRFERQSATGMALALGADGFLYDPDHPPGHTTIVDVI